MPMKHLDLYGLYQSAPFRGRLKQRYCTFPFHVYFDQLPYRIMYSIGFSHSNSGSLYDLPNKLSHNNEPTLHFKISHIPHYNIFPTTRDSHVANFQN